MNDLIFWLKQNPVPSLLGTGLAVSLIMSYGPIYKNVQGSKELLKFIDENRQKENVATAAVEHESEQAKIAETRYNSGCLPVFTGEKINTFSSLTTGLPVVDRNRRKPLPDGTVVCDGNGNTGEIVNGVVGATAYTGNQTAINLVRQKFSARYYVPTMKDN